MSGTKPQDAIVRTFLTHAMEDAAINALDTGREEVAERILAVARANLAAAPGRLRHVMLFAPRGFGKTFMTRVMEIKTKALSTPARPVVTIPLPEEQQDLIRNPHALLDNIASRLADARAGSSQTWSEGFFQWPRPEAAKALWDKAAARVEAELDASLAGGGLVIVTLENFDTVLATVFKDKPAEKRLIQWLGRAGNRLMLLATGTRTAEIDYDSDLMRAFQEDRLPPWTRDECIAYFNKRRALEKREPLDGATEARGRAIADFIGGNPRLAHLLYEVLDTRDPLRVVDTMNALADELAEYYRQRIADLPPLARGMVDALIRGGEPCSATELARRVGAEQSDIARVMQDLRRADVIRGTPAEDSRETLFRIIDRVFVHYYRLRQLHQAPGQSPLETILDLLQAFYSKNEQRAQAANYIMAGRFKEARVFTRLAFGKDREGADPDTEAGDPSTQASAMRHKADWLGDLARHEDAIAAADAAAKLAAEAGDRREQATATSIKAWSLVQLGRHEDAIAAADAAAKLAAEAGDRGEQAAATRLKAWSLGQLGRHEDAIAAADAAAALAAEAGDRREQARVTSLKAWSLGQLGRHEDAIAAADAAAALAAQAGDRREQTAATRHKAWSLGQLGRHEDAIAAADAAAALAAEAGDKVEQARATYYKAGSLSDLGRHEDAIAAADAAAGLAAEAGDRREQAIATRYKAWSLGQLGRHEDAIAAADAAAALAAEAGDRGEQARATRYKALSLVQLGRHEDAIAAADAAAKLAAEAGDRGEQARATSHKAWSLGQLGRHEDAIAAADAAAAIAAEADDRGEQAWSLRVLSILIDGFAQACRDPALIRTVAERMSPTSGDDFPRLLRHLATYDEGPGGEKGLARVDPDVATWIRRVRGLPEPSADPAPKRGRRGKTG